MTAAEGVGPPSVPGGTGLASRRQIRPMRKSDAKGGFSCGRPALDAFFPKRAWAHQESGVSRVYVLEELGRPDDESGEILGFYTLSASAVARERLQGPLPGSLPRYPLPVFYIGFFAVAQSRQRQGLGRRLMADALRRCVEGAEQIGAGGVFLDSLDDESTEFYRSLSFVEIVRAPDAAQDGPQPMFLPMRVLRQSLPPGVATGPAPAQPPVER